MSAEFRRPDTIVATAAQLKARTPGTRSTGPETTKGTTGVGVFVAEEWMEKIFEAQRVSDRINLVKLIFRPACS